MIRYCDADLLSLEMHIAFPFDDMKYTDGRPVASIIEWSMPDSIPIRRMATYVWHPDPTHHTNQSGYKIDPETELEGYHLEGWDFIVTAPGIIDVVPK